LAILSYSLGRRRDWPQLEAASIPGAAAGSATDFEFAALTVPDLTQTTPAASTGSAGDLPINALKVRQIALAPNTTITGQATNFFTYFVYQKRNLAVSTTALTTVTSGSTVITPVSMNNINVGTKLLVDTVASGVQETVTVTAVTGTTFTASFSNAHDAGGVTPYPIVNSPLASLLVSTASATSVTSGATVITPTSMSNIAVNSVLTFSGGTGASENVTVSAVTATTFTATFANNHSGAYTIKSAPIASYGPYSATTVVSTALLPQIATMTTPYNIFLPNDVLTFARTSNNATGLISPAGTLFVEWVPAGVGK